MQKPSLGDYRLSPNDVSDFERTQKLAARWMRSLGALAGALGGVVWEVYFGANPGLVFLSAVFTAFFGWGMGVALEDPAARRWDSRIDRYDQFKKALRAFEDWELRTRSEFWLSLSGHRFERELAALFRSQGYNVEVTPGSGDHGVDIILRRAGRTTVVQCKQNKHPVGPAVARELYGTLIASKADDGILAAVGGVTSGVHILQRQASSRDGIVRNPHSPKRDPEQPVNVRSTAC